MPTPPDPLVPELLLAAASRLGFRIIIARSPDGNELGELVDGDTVHHFIATHDGWLLVDRLSPGFGAFLVSRTTCDVLRTGQADGKGGIIFQGMSYRLHTWFDSQNWTAKALAA